MANLTLTIGPVTATVSATDAKALDILTAYASAIGASGTNQQKANAVVASLAYYMREVAQGAQRRAVVEQAITAAQPQVDALDWS